MEQELRRRKSNAIVNAGLVSNIFLSIVKTAAGIAGHSPARLADGINSTSDVAYYVAVKIFIRLAGEPADHEHPYGHSQMESIGALVVGSFVITTAVAIFWTSVNNVYDLLSGKSEFEGAAGIALWIALFTITLKIFLTIITKRVSESTKNPSVEALAHDHRNDMFSACAVAVGIFLGRAGYPWVDPLAGALVAVAILCTGIEILRGSSRDLMDTVPGEHLSKRIQDLINDIPEIKRIDEILAHRFGP